MSATQKVRLNRLFRQGKCLDVAIDHGIANEPDFLSGLENIAEVMAQLIAARPDAIQVNYGQADLLQQHQGDKPALVMRTDVGNAYNQTRHREMWAVLHNPEEPVLAALQMDAAAVVANLYLIPDEPTILRMCIENICRLRHACERYGMPLMVDPPVRAPPTDRWAMWRRWCRWFALRANWAPILSKPIPPIIRRSFIASSRRRAARRWCAAAAKAKSARCWRKAPR